MATSISLAYGVGSLSISISHLVFILFYIPLFFSVHKITSYYFYFGQIIYLFWNTINDPLLGSLSDSETASAASRRVPVLKFCGPLCALAFLLMWMPIGCFSGDCSAQPSDFAVFLFFVCTTFIYDGLFTYLNLAHSALLADLSTDHHTRAMLNRSQALFSIVAAVAVVVSSWLWQPPALQSFRLWMISIASVSTLGWIWTARQVELFLVEQSYSKSPSDSKFTLTQVSVDVFNSSPTVNSTLLQSADQLMPESGSNLRKPEATTRVHSLITSTQLPPLELHHSEKFAWLSGMWKFSQEIMSLSSFRWFVAMNSAQQFMCSFNNNFWIIFLDIFFGGWLLPWQRAVLVAGAFVLPHLNTIIWTPTIQRIGTYRVIHILFRIRLVGALFAAFVVATGLSSSICAGCLIWFQHLFGQHEQSLDARGIFSSQSASQNPQLVDISTTILFVIGVFLVFNRVMTEAICRLMNLVISDIVDEDAKNFDRISNRSASIFGLQSFLTKPLTSLAPMFGWWVLDHAGLKPAPFTPSSDHAVSSVSLSIATLSKNSTSYSAISLDANPSSTSMWSSIMSQVTRILSFEQSPLSTQLSANRIAPRPSQQMLWASTFLLIGVPLVLVALQICFWSRYPLHGPSLRTVKQVDRTEHHSDE